LCGKEEGKPAALHFQKVKSKNGTNTGICAVRYHNPDFFGLCYADCALLGKDPLEWESPSKKEIEENIRRIEGFQAKEKMQNSEAESRVI
jgi:hypothetical protein